MSASLISPVRSRLAGFCIAGVLMVGCRASRSAAVSEHHDQRVLPTAAEPQASVALGSNGFGASVSPVVSTESVVTSPVDEFASQGDRSCIDSVLIPSEMIVASENESLPSPRDPNRIVLISQQELFSEISEPKILRPLPRIEDLDPLFPGQRQLPLDDLVAQVLRVNPTMQVAIATWQAASQRYPQDVALDDPMLLSMIGPQGLASNQVNGSYVIGLSQKVPWKGKRELRGRMALWEQTATQWDTQDVRLQLTEATKLAYYEYYLVSRELEVNIANTNRTQEFRDTAKSRYEAGQVQQQDLLQADVELGQLERRHLELIRERQVASARINTLLHRDPALALLPPPDHLDVSGEAVAPEILQQVAHQNRPDLTALSARIQAERASVELACKEFYPDFEFMARYDAFWQEKPLRPMIGMNVNIPINQGRRHAAVNEAIFRMQKLTAEYAQLSDAVRRDVETASAMLAESRSVVALYEEKILPAAEANVASAEAGYASGRIDFLRLIEAQRQLIELSEERHQAVAAYYSRYAELERIIGGSLSLPEIPGEHEPMRAVD